VLNCAAKIVVYFENKMNIFHVVQHNSQKLPVFRRINNQKERFNNKVEVLRRSKYQHPVFCASFTAFHEGCSTA
jgi:hypothetical protein